MKDLSTHDQIFLQMSGAFLTEHLPPEYLEWAEKGEEDKMEKFFLDHVVEEYEYWDCVKCLLEHNANRTIKNKEGHTAETGIDGKKTPKKDIPRITHKNDGEH